MPAAAFVARMQEKHPAVHTRRSTRVRISSSSVQCTRTRQSVPTGGGITCNTDTHACLLMQVAFTVPCKCMYVVMPKPGSTLCTRRRPAAWRAGRGNADRARGRPSQAPLEASQQMNSRKPNGAPYGHYGAAACYSATASAALATSAAAAAAAPAPPTTFTRRPRSSPPCPKQAQAAAAAP